MVTKDGDEVLVTRYMRVGPFVTTIRHLLSSPVIVTIQFHLLRLRPE